VELVAINLRRLGWLVLPEYIQELLSSFNRKLRIVPTTVGTTHGWKPIVVATSSSWLKERASVG
jgi:hypothetical protein